MRKKFLLFLCILTTLFSALALSSCQINLLLFEFCISHEYGEWKILEPASCLHDGIKQRICSDCDKKETEVILAAGEHSFGSWNSENDYKTRTCSSCYYEEMVYIPEEEEHPDISATKFTYAIYNSFDIFAQDVSVGKGSSELTYKGNNRRLIINLKGETYSCNNRTIVIPSQIENVRFRGQTQGSPFQNTRFVIADRSTDLQIFFENVRIESEKTIITSNSSSINVRLDMQGEHCLFKISEKAKSGAPGYDKGATDLWMNEAGPGGDGENGAPTFVINGNCNVFTATTLLEIYGGEGGDGGRGGSVPYKPTIWGSGANGGRGGNGGNAFACENNVKIHVTKENTQSFILGGKGGIGGNGGTKHDVWPFTGEDGKKGYDGADGEPGCYFIYLIA